MLSKCWIWSSLFRYYIIERSFLDPSFTSENVSCLSIFIDVFYETQSEGKGIRVVWKKQSVYNGD